MTLESYESGGWEVRAVIAEDLPPCDGASGGAREHDGVSIVLGWERKL